MGEKKYFKGLTVLLIILFSFIYTSCDSKKLNGRWESSAAISYEFSKSTYTMEIKLPCNVVKVSGTYRLSDDEIFTKAQKISHDNGITWEENDGELISVEEVSQPIVFNSDETISISKITYKNIK